MSSSRVGAQTLWKIVAIISQEVVMVNANSLSQLLRFVLMMSVWLLQATHTGFSVVPIRSEAALGCYASLAELNCEEPSPRQLFLPPSTRSHLRISRS